MKTVADLSINQLNSLARIAMLRLDNRAIFMADSPKPVFKETLKDELTPYEMRIMLKLLPDLNAGRAPIITDNDEPGLMLVKATWCGINTYGLERFFVGGSPDGYGTFKNRYLRDSVTPAGAVLECRDAIAYYVNRLERLFAIESNPTKPEDDVWLKPSPYRIGDYWDNVVVRRHLGKDPAKWAEHVKKHKGNNNV
jgi:hypothetical protein